MSDPTTLNPVNQIDQLTAFVLTPICVRCGYAGFSVRKDNIYRCDSCHRTVTMVEYTPTVLSENPNIESAGRLFHNRTSMRVLEND